MKTVRTLLEDTNQMLLDVIKHTDIPTRKPANVSAADHEILLGIKKAIYDIEHQIDPEIAQITINGKLRNLRLSPEQIKSAYTGTKQQTTTTKLATYYKNDTLSYDKFLENVKNVDSFLATLTGYHKKAIAGLKIRFVSGSTIRSKAQYKTNEDTIYINVSKMGNTTEEYGSLRYVVLHELGHRYLKKFPQNWNIDKPELTTTKYSMTETLTNEERFAELFAISHWPKKYPQLQNRSQNSSDYSIRTTYP